MKFGSGGVLLKRFTRGFILFVFSVTIYAVPCFGEDLLSSGPQSGNAQTGVLLYAQEDSSGEIVMEDEELEYDDDPDYMEEDEELAEFADPLEPLNRAFFYVNDKLYFWILKPAAQGYSAIVPEGARISVKNFFTNIATPVRLVNNLLQWKVKSAGNELLRFGINSTFGMLGLFDVAKTEMGISRQDEDFGQTLGVWGLGQGIYLHWPLLGPSSLRDSIGFAGDYFLDPVNYVSPAIDRIAIKAGDRVNRTSLSIGDYEAIKEEALDPYSAVKDIYYQYRESRVER
jgi:phospholipid-binding lipoprotein MlaA